jgi:class 3 adenylate cyclase
MTTTDATSLSFQGFTLDLEAHTLIDPGGREVAMRRSEFALLRAFLAAPGRALNRDRLLDAVAGRRSEPFDRSIDVLVGRLRRKIEADPSAPRLIVTVPGVGYRFTVKPQPVSAESATSGTADAAEPARAPERRQLTVMRCRLSGPALCAARRDPEDLQRLLRVFDEYARSIICEAGGTVDQFLNDGVLAYFGHPQADEHQAERAVRVALELIEQAATIDTGQLGRLHLRIGVSTGLAVVRGQSDASRDPMMLGEAAHLAAGLAASAEADTVLISASTRRLVRERFEFLACEPVRTQGADEAV